MGREGDLLTRNYKADIKNGSNWKQKTESIDCAILTLLDYKERHDKIKHYIHRKYGILDCETWYKHQPEQITESKRAIQTDVI